MILAKSRRSAILLAIIVFLSMGTSLFIWFSVIAGLQGNPINPFQNPNIDIGNIFGILALLFFFMVLPGAFLIYGREEAYFGLRGAVRWALFGLLWPAMVLSIDMLLPDFASSQSFGLNFLERLINVIIGLLCAITLFRFTFLGVHSPKTG